jgi:hypothetical protein
MSCVLDTDSIDLDDSGGVLQAALRLDPAVLNLLAVTAAGARVDPNGGWLALPAVLAYSSGTGTNEGVYTTSADLRPYVSAGMRIKFVQGGVTKYMEVVALDGTTITLERHYISYAIGGTAAVDADAAICSYNSTGGGRFTYGRTKRQTGLTAVTLTMKYRKNATDGSNSNWLERSMKAAPVRIG